MALMTIDEKEIRKHPRSRLSRNTYHRQDRPFWSHGLPWLALPRQLQTWELLLSLAHWKLFPVILSRQLSSYPQSKPRGPDRITSVIDLKRIEWLGFYLSVDLKPDVTLRTTFHNRPNGHETNDQCLAWLNGDVHFFSNIRAPKEVACGNNTSFIYMRSELEQWIFHAIPEISIFCQETLILLENLDVAIIVLNKPAPGNIYANFCTLGYMT